MTIPGHQGSDAGAQLSEAGVSVTDMWSAIWLPLAAALVVTFLTVILRRPRERSLRLLRRIRRAMSLRRSEDTERAIERIAAELAARRCSQEGNPDDEYYSDWYHWFTGDPEANVNYSRKQQRDRARLERGDYRRR